jgi:hypothetical protein
METFQVIQIQAHQSLTFSIREVSFTDVRFAFSREFPYQRREVAGCVPGHVLRVLRVDLRTEHPTPSRYTLTDTPQAVTAHPRASEKDVYLEIPNTRRKQ